MPVSAFLVLSGLSQLYCEFQLGCPLVVENLHCLSILLAILRKTRSRCRLTETDPAWQLEEANFEKMGAMMAENHSKLLGLYGELSTFLNLYKSRGLTDSHDLAVFLQLYNGYPWSRRKVRMRIHVCTCACTYSPLY